MVAVEARRKCFSAIESGVAPFGQLSLPEPVTVQFEPVDLVLLDLAGWRGLASTLSWDVAYLRSFDDLVDQWLLGSDHRRLLDIASEQLSSGGVGLDFGDLALAWLDRERLERLVSLVEASHGEYSVYALCYCLGKAFMAVGIAKERVESVPGFTDEELSLVPADDAQLLGA